MAATLTLTGITPLGAVQGVGATFASNLPDATDKTVIVTGIITLSGSYTAGGDPLSIVSSTVGLPFAFGGLAPVLGSVRIEEIGVIGTAVSGFKYVYVYGPTLANPTQNGGAIQIFGTGASSGAGGTQISGAYSGTSPALSTQTLSFWAQFAIS